MFTVACETDKHSLCGWQDADVVPPEGRHVGWRGVVLMVLMVLLVLLGRGLVLRLDVRDGHDDDGVGGGGVVVVGLGGLLSRAGRLQVGTTRNREWKIIGMHIVKCCHSVVLNEHHRMIVTNLPFWDHGTVTMTVNLRCMNFGYYNLNIKITQN